MRQNQFAFVPSINSLFSDRKRVPPGCGIQCVNETTNYPKDWENRIRLVNKAQTSEGFRQELINSHAFGSKFPQVNYEKQVNEREIIRVKRNDGKIWKECPSNDCSSSLSTSFTSSSSFNASKLPLTVVEPFNLSFEYRPKKQVQETESFQKFVPRKPPKFNEPFKPVLVGSNVTRVEGFSFSTEARAEKRGMFEERIKANNRAREAEIMMRKQMEEEQEREEIKRIRKQMEFKANKLPNLAYGKNGGVPGLSSLRGGLRK